MDASQQPAADAPEARPPGPAPDAAEASVEKHVADVKEDVPDTPEAAAEASDAQSGSSPRSGAGVRCSVGAALGVLATAALVHYYINAASVSAAKAVVPPHNLESRLKLKGVAGPFDVELEKAELCEREKQGVGAAKMDWGSVEKDKDVPKRYHINGRGSFNYNTSDDLGAKVLLALWTFPGSWVTYYSNSFRGGCSMAKNFAPERWRRVSLMLFGHENAECPFPPIRVDVSNFTIENRGGQGMLKEFIYGRWKVENQIFDFTNNRAVSCGRAIVRVVPKQKEKPMPAVVPAFDNSESVSIELLEPADAPP